MVLHLLQKLNLYLETSKQIITTKLPVTNSPVQAFPRIVGGKNHIKHEQIP